MTRNNHTPNEPVSVHDYPSRITPSRDLSPAVEIIKAVANEYGVHVSDMLGESKRREISVPRQKAYTRVRDELGYSHPRIAYIFRRKCHTTVMYGINAHRKREAADRAQREAMQ
jgi:chromosomal replication initiator protein